MNEIIRSKLRSALSGGGRITFPPGLGEPAILSDLPELLSDRDYELLIVGIDGAVREFGNFGTNVRIRSLYKKRGVDVSSYAPVLYGSIPRLIERGAPLEIDIAIVRLSPADANGFHNVGPTASVTGDMIKNARIVIAEIDPDLPLTCGDTRIPTSLVCLQVPASRPLQLSKDLPPEGFLESAQTRARSVASLVPDGAVLEVGVGSQAQAILEELEDHRDLRVHSGLLSSALHHLLVSPAADPDWRAVIGDANGPACLMEYVHLNPRLSFQSSRIVHNPSHLARYDSFVTINSVLAVDLLGRAACETSAGAWLGGIGGLHEFLEGGRLSPNGRNIIVLPSRSVRNRPRVVRELPSADVSIPAYLIDFIVTEWGIADLRAASRQERVERISAIMHPEDLLLCKDTEYL